MGGPTSHLSWDVPLPGESKMACLSAPPKDVNCRIGFRPSCSDSYLESFGPYSRHWRHVGSFGARLERGSGVSLSQEQVARKADRYDRRPATTTDG